MIKTKRQENSKTKKEHKTLKEDFGFRVTDQSMRQDRYVIITESVTQKMPTSESKGPPLPAQASSDDFV